MIIRRLNENEHGILDAIQSIAYGGSNNVRESEKSPLRSEVWGAFDDDFLVGVCAMRDLSHIELLYVDGAYHRQGIATNLLKHAFIDCKELDETLNRVTVNATPFSRGFFLKQGFTATAAERKVDGLTYIPMALQGEVI